MELLEALFSSIATSEPWTLQDVIWVILCYFPLYLGAALLKRQHSCYNCANGEGERREKNEKDKWQEETPFPSREKEKNNFYDLILGVGERLLSWGRRILSPKTNSISLMSTPQGVRFLWTSPSHMFFLHSAYTIAMRSGMNGDQRCKCTKKKKDLHKAWRAWGNTDTGLWAGDRSSLSEVAESISNWETGQESLLSVFLHEVLLAHLTPHLEGITQFVISVFRGCWPLLWSTEGCVSCKALFPSHLQFGYYSHFFLNWAFPWLSVTI